LIKFFGNLINPRIFFFDVGANKGQSTEFFRIILNKNKITNTQMHLFEPDVDLANNLKKNFKDVNINQIALSNTTGRKKLFLYKNNEKNSFYEIITKNDGDTCIGTSECNTQKLDDYCKQKNINKISFLKIDCEGEEINVLDGSKNLIRNNRIDYIYIETTLGESYKKKCSNIGDIESKLCNNFELLAIENHNELNFKVQIQKRLTISFIYKLKKIKTPHIFLDNVK
jgi:FkbM family methyltransferase